MSNSELHGLDADEVLLTAEVTIRELKASDKASLKCVELLECLYEQTKSYVSDGISIDKAQYTAQEWANFLRYDIGSSTEASEFIRRHLKILKSHIGEQSAIIDEKVKEAGCKHRLVISNTQSRGHHKTYYFLDLEPIETNEPVRTAPPLSVTYRVTSLEKPLPWAKPLLKVDLEGSKRLIPVGIVLVAAFSLVGLFALVLTGAPRVSIFLTTVIVMGLISVARPIWRIMDTGVAFAPEWLYGIGTRSAFFEYKATNRLRSDCRPIKQLRLAVYKGRCGVCGADLEIVPGRGEFRNRLIGQCVSAGGEHIYSFDHISKIGVPLRTNAYYGQADSYSSVPLKELHEES
jgi:hypothetical protein